MAISPISEYPNRVAAPDSNYPYGSARNSIIPNDGTGTPWEKDLVNDLLGFQQAILADAGITPNGLPDTSLASQYLDGLKSITGARYNLFPANYGAVGDGVTDDTQAWLDVIADAQALVTANSFGGVSARNVTIHGGGQLYALTDEILWSLPVEVNNTSFVALPTFNSVSGYMGRNTADCEGQVFSGVSWDGGTRPSGDPQEFTHYPTIGCFQNNARGFTYRDVIITHFNTVGLHFAECGRCVLGGSVMIHKYAFRDWFGAQGALTGAVGQDWQHLVGSTGLKCDDADGIFNNVISFLSEYPIHNLGTSNMFNNCHPWNFEPTSNIPAEIYVIRESSGFGCTFNGGYYDSGCILIEDDTGNGFGVSFSGGNFTRTQNGSVYRFELRTSIPDSDGAGFSVNGIMTGSVTNLINYTTTGAGTWDADKRLTWGPIARNGGGFAGDAFDLQGHVVLNPNNYQFGNGNGEPVVTVNGQASASRALIYQTGGVNRCSAGADDAAETGSNSGSNYELNANDDLGAFLRRDLRIRRDNGLWIIGGDFRTDTDDTHDLGANSFQFANMFTRRVTLPQGIDAPAAIAGKAQLFIGAGNIPQIRLGNGTILTLSFT